MEEAARFSLMSLWWRVLPTTSSRPRDLFTTFDFQTFDKERSDWLGMISRDGNSPFKI